MHPEDSGIPLQREAPRPTLPVELYSHVFAFIYRDPDLCRFALVSRMFYRETIPFLYHTIDLSVQWNRIFSFGLAIKSNPELALHVRVLTLALWSDAPTDLEDLIGEILCRVQNLRTLTMEPSSREFEDFPGLTRGIPFQLHTFHNHCLDLPDTISFLRSQPHITDWTHLFPHCGQRPVFLEGHLPNITTICVEASVLQAFNTARPVKQMFVCYDDDHPEMQDFTPFGLFRETLVTLCWDRSLSSSDVGAPDAMALLVKQMPRLKHLCIIDVNNDRIQAAGTAQLNPFDTLLHSLSLFKNLETFAYSPPISDTTSFWWTVCRDKGFEQVARELFSAQPRLRRITFHDHSQPDVKMEDWVTNGVCYAKGPGGDTASPLTFDSWKELW
ncbi:hypothetical protein JAAARDRAFT_421754 [Jaapia argillacea MUCL 33604]|uniref:Uncharacterized protein n=1 Tax=Jaapia argillacea MUCL 33604 TaxID=933084 RepID=A0A067PFN8_9AGAM|nr:hypothetical protein JAAARDRAFT_421754 [Jaapia argillacea MUCL 33604]